MQKVCKQKMLSLTIPELLLVISQLPSILCSFPLVPLHRKAGHFHSRRSKQETQMTPRLLSEIAVHGFLFWASMGFLIPVGILIMRKSNKEKSAKRLKILFYIHTVIQILSVFLMTVGAVLSFKNFDNAFNNDHQRLGLAIYGLVWMQFFVGIVRPHKGSKGRIVWYVVHWLMGTVVSFLGVIAIYTGLQAYHKRTSKSVQIWTVLFTVEIIMVIFFYLFQEKWNYIKKQSKDHPIRLSDQPQISTKQMEPLESRI